MKIHLYFITLIITLLIIVNKSGYTQNVNSETSKILILHSMKEKRPWNLLYNKSFRDAVKSYNNLDVEF